MARRTQGLLDFGKIGLRGFAQAAETELKLPAQHTISGRYAAALYMAAAKADKLAAVEQELSQVATLVADSDDFKEFVLDPSIPTQAKVEGLNAVLGKLQASDITKNFVALLSENNRLTQLNSILSSFENIAAEQRGEVTAVVTTAENLEADEVDEIVDGLTKLLQPGQTLMLEQQVNPSIIGGVIIDIGDKHIDLSILSRIQKLQQILRDTV